ncbi:hypothetical protein N6H18_13905 [Reichenbachiella agarivorans]|uniref:GLPGLI family protein n=1 Tax=Reichenbachiella agarivorans TaxID=2979464 RepID=A0ABY6CLQ5_9BACT|nr:hypothetical protein [Reichenbachiella agarivorans]UXP31445.1 hypothetical protein N6H18_13905 [Reichenbachiella agarivorans]
MIKYLTFISLFFVSWTGYSQEFSSRVWHKGWLVTMDGDTVHGDLKYDMEVNTIQILNENQKIQAYNSKKVMYVEFFDSVLKNYRKFYSIPYNVSYDFRAPILFEVLYEGPTTLLCREKIVVETDPYSQSYYGVSTVSRERVSLTYYFAFKSGEIVMYSGKKGELFTILDQRPDQIKEYIKKNRLDPNEVRDLIRIVAFYNSI